MFAHKINDLSFGEKLVEGTVFTHVSKAHMSTRNYEITGIKFGDPLVNDGIILKDLNSEAELFTVFTVEPEWFNQRIKGIKFK